MNIKYATFIIVSVAMLGGCGGDSAATKRSEESLDLSAIDKSLVTEKPSIVPVTDTPVISPGKLSDGNVAMVRRKAKESESKIAHP